jgi:hypothetical protein
MDPHDQNRNGGIGASLFALAAAFAAPIAAIVTWNLHDAGHREAPLVAAGIAGACLSAALVIGLRHGWRLALAGGVVAIGAGTAVGLFGLTALHRAQCGVAMLDSGVVLRQVTVSQHERVQQGLPLDVPVALGFADGTFVDAPLNASWCNLRTPHDVRIGPYSLADLRAGRVSLDQLRAAATVAPGAWEFVGPFAVSHEAEAYRSERANLIVGFCVFPFDEPEHWVIVFANGFFAPYRPGHLADVLRADRAARLELGLAPPPEVGPIAVGMARLRELEAAKPE